MESLYLLVPLSVALVFLIGVVFWRALDSGQFDDLDRPSHDVVSDDDTPEFRTRYVIPNPPTGRR